MSFDFVTGLGVSAREGTFSKIQGGGGGPSQTVSLVTERLGLGGEVWSASPPPLDSGLSSQGAGREGESDACVVSECPAEKWLGEVKGNWFHDVRLASTRHQQAVPHPKNYG